MPVIDRAGAVSARSSGNRDSGPGSVGSARSRARRLLCDVSNTAALDADILLQYCLNKDRVWLLAHAEAQIPPAIMHRFDALIRRRADGEPVAYLTGQCGFWTLDLRVTAATLIPRPETEVLVEQALARIPNGKPWRVADLGTGCGAIALAVASERPRVRVTATDTSSGALEVARDNSVRLGVHNVEFRQGHWFSAVESQRFHAILANPPYIGLQDRSLTRDGVRFEPKLALLGGRDGMDALECIIGRARHHLLPGGWLLVEHGCDQGAAVRRLMEQNAGGGISTSPDYSGRDRVSVARFGT